MNQVNFSLKRTLVLSLLMSLCISTGKATDLDQALDLLKAKLLCLVELIPPRDEKKLLLRLYKRNNQLIPIYFTPKEMLSVYKTPTKKVCYVVGGPFTYYGAIPPEPGIYENRGEKIDVHNDSGWGCAWRASLNVLNKVKGWLEKTQNIRAIPPRSINMYDIQGWTKLKWHKWIEPPDNAEIFLRWTQDEKWYSESDREKIKKLLDEKKMILRGRLYLNSKDKKDELLEESFRYKDVNLEKLRDYLGIDKKASHADTLKAFYHDDFCFINKNIPVENFPKFDEKTNPFPINIDDGTYARNIYGYCSQDDKTVSHIFIGETHTGKFGYDANPWKASGWKPIEKIFDGNDIMIFEVFLNKPSAKIK